MRVLEAASLRGLVDDSPVKIERIHFDGITRTKKDALVSEVRELYNVSTFKELVQKTYQTKMHMQHVGLFEAIGAIVDVDRKSDNPNGYELTFVVKEPARNKGTISLGLSQRGEASTIAQYNSSSSFGRGEEITGEVSWGMHKTHQFKLNITKPFLGWQRQSGFRTFIMRNYASFPWSGFGNVECGLGAEIYRKTFGNFSHQLGVCGSWRYLSVLNNATAFDVREFSGHTLKSSLFNILSYSTQDCENLPTKGVLAKVSQEICGGFLGGDIKFLKHDLIFRATAPLFKGSYLSFGLQGTHVVPRSGPTLHILDRSFLGGPHNIRGFSMNGIGPSIDTNALGGTTTWAAGAHLYHPILKKWLGESINLHGFAVAGNIHGVDPGATTADVARRLFHNPRASVGAGIAIRLGNFGRIEVNYCFPFSSSYTDRQEPGIQFGIGTSFL